MRHITFIIICIAFTGIFATHSAYADRATAKQCAKWEKSLTKVNKKLRAGYSVEQGNKLREKRRKLESKLFKKCH